MKNKNSVFSLTLFFAVLFLLLLVLPMFELLRAIFGRDDLDLVFDVLLKDAIFIRSIKNSFTIAIITSIVSILLIISIASCVTKFSRTEKDKTRIIKSISFVKYSTYLMISLAFYNIFASPNGVMAYFGINARGTLSTLVIMGVWMNLVTGLTVMINKFHNDSLEINPLRKIYGKLGVSIYFKHYIWSNRIILLRIISLSFISSFSINPIAMMSNTDNVFIYEMETVSFMALYYAMKGNFSISAIYTLVQLVVLILPFIVMAKTIKNKKGKTLNYSNQRIKVSAGNKNWFNYGIVLLIFIPIITSFIISFRVHTNTSMNSMTWGFGNYTDFWSKKIISSLINTIIYSISSSLIIFASYTLLIYVMIYRNNKNFIGFKIIDNLFMASILLPTSLISIGIFITLSNIGFNKTILPIIVSALLAPKTYFIIKQSSQSKYDKYKEVINVNNVGFWFGYKKIFLDKNIAILYIGWNFISHFDSFNLPTLFSTISGIPTFGLSLISISNENGTPLREAQSAIMFASIAFIVIAYIIIKKITKEIIRLWKNY